MGWFLIREISEISRGLCVQIGDDCTGPLLDGVSRSDRIGLFGAALQLGKEVDPCITKSIKNQIKVTQLENKRNKLSLPGLESIEVNDKRGHN